MRLAEPVAVVVVVGELDLPDRFTRRGQILRDEVETYAAELRETGLVDEVEALYGELKTALRRLRTGPL
jgi:hypothetical protein